MKPPPQLFNSSFAFLQNVRVGCVAVTHCQSGRLSVSRLEPLDASICIVIFVLGVFVMRAAGCVINDFADRDFDGHVTRTRGRPLATGALSARQALMLFAALGLIALGLVLCLNRFTLVLSFGGLGLAVLYPFTKRFTYLPQLFLGAAFSWAIPMAFAAETESEAQFDADAVG